jgi:hypothetical protein
VNDAQTLHRQAMELAEEAALEQAAGQMGRAKELYTAAFECERQAAERLDTRLDMEPTRSVLFRSAASLALDCHDVRSAEKLIARALTGDPPPEIASELRDLLEQVYFHRHLDLRGVILGPREFQMSISGEAVGLGVADSEVFVSRVQDIEKLIFRTAERRAQRPFRERGRRHKVLAGDVALYLSVPRAASFAVSFRIGYSEQMPLPGMDPAEGVIAELLDCIDMVGAGELREMEKRIPDPSYRRNFFALARRVAPDGKAVQAVGFTAAIRGTERRVLLTRTSDDIILPEAATVEGDSRVHVQVQGTLKYADSTKTERNEIRIVDADGKTHKVIVPEGMMDDIVRPLWDFVVLVRGTRTRNVILLQDVSRAEDGGSD